MSTQAELMAALEDPRAMRIRVAPCGNEETPCATRSHTHTHTHTEAYLNIPTDASAHPSLLRSFFGDPRLPLSPVA